MKRFLLAALLALLPFAGLAPAQAAAPAVSAHKPGIHVEMRGTLSAVWSRVRPVSFHMDVQGTTYRLQFNDPGQRREAERLEGLAVVVTGELRGQVVEVYGIRSDVTARRTEVKIKGKVVENMDLAERGGPARFLWEVTANGRKFELDLSGNPELLAMARLFRGKTLVVTGTLVEYFRDDGIYLELARPEFHTLPAWRSTPLRSVVMVTGLAIEPGEDEYVADLGPILEQLVRPL